MTEFDRKEYQTVILGALLHVDRSRFIGDVVRELCLKN